MESYAATLSPHTSATPSIRCTARIQRDHFQASSLRENEDAFLGAKGRHYRARAASSTVQRDWHGDAGGPRTIYHGPRDGRREGRRVDRKPPAKSGIFGRRGSAGALYRESGSYGSRARSRRTRISRTRTSRFKRYRCFAADHDRGGARSYVWRRLRAGAGLRSDYRGQDDALLFSGVASWAHSRLRRDSAIATRYRQWPRA